MGVELALPPRGEGDIFIRSENLVNGKKLLNSFLERKSKRVIYYLVFEHYMPGRVMVLKGTYIRGKNLVRYYGDFFFMNKQRYEETGLDFTRIDSDDGHDGLKYAGGLL